jgi:hypothetical protein
MQWQAMAGNRMDEPEQCQEQPAYCPTPHEIKAQLDAIKLRPDVPIEVLPPEERAELQ